MPPLGSEGSHIAGPSLAADELIAAAIGEAVAKGAEDSKAAPQAAAMRLGDAQVPDPRRPDLGEEMDDEASDCETNLCMICIISCFCT